MIFSASVAKNFLRKNVIIDTSSNLSFQECEAPREYTSAHADSPLGRIMLDANDNCWVELWLEGRKCFGDTIDGEFLDKPDLPVFTSSRLWLDNYCTGKKSLVSDLPLAPQAGNCVRKFDKFCARSQTIDS